MSFKRLIGRFLALLSFFGVNPENPRILGFVGDETPKIPKIEDSPVPRISPNYFWGFSGIKPPKPPIFNPTPSPKNPQCFSIPCPHPRPVLENSGTGREWGHGMKKNWGRGWVENWVFLGSYPRKSPKKIWGYFGDGVGLKIGYFGVLSLKIPENNLGIFWGFIANKPQN